MFVYNDELESYGYSIKQMFTKGDRLGERTRFKYIFKYVLVQIVGTVMK